MFTVDYRSQRIVSYLSLLNNGFTNEPGLGGSHWLYAPTCARKKSFELSGTEQCQSTEDMTEH